MFPTFENALSFRLRLLINCRSLLIQITLRKLRVCQLFHITFHCMRITEIKTNKYACNMINIWNHLASFGQILKRITFISIYIYILFEHSFCEILFLHNYFSFTRGHRRPESNSSVFSYSNLRVYYTATDTCTILWYFITWV